MLNDMTQGKPSRIILHFSIPLILSTAIQQLYNIADSMIVGKLDSAAGLAAIGAAYPLTLFFVAVGTGASMGCSVIISQLFGAKRMRDMKSAVNTALVSLTALGALLSLLGVVLSGPLMRLTGCGVDTFDNAKAYLAIYSVGVLPMLVYNAASAAFTALGNSRLPLIFLIISSLLNVVLDIIAVGPMGFGVVGAAWATTISQFVAAILATSVLLKKMRAVQAEDKAALFDREQFASMTRIAVPSICQQTCVALSHTVVQSLVNSFGQATMAGYEAASKIHNFAYMSFNTIGTALSSFVAQNYGAGQTRRIRQGYKVSSLICLCVTAFVIAVMQIFAEPLIGLFIDAGEGEYEQMLRVGMLYLRIISPDYLMICFVITSGGLLRGLGEINKFFFVTVLDFAVRVSMCFVMTAALDSFVGLYWPWYFGTAVDLAICLFWYARMCRRGGKLAEN